MQHESECLSGNAQAFRKTDGDRARVSQRAESRKPDVFAGIRDLPHATRVRLVQQHATWHASQPARTESTFASTFRANQKLGSPLSLKQVKRIAKKALPNPKISHVRDPVLYHQARQTIAEAHAALHALPWAGAFAHHCRIAMTHILDRMHHTGKTAIALSTRDLADGIGVQQKSAASYLRALRGNSPRRLAAVPVLLTRTSLRTSDPTAANVYRLRPRRAWRVPPGGSYMCEVQTAQKHTQNSAQNIQKMTSRDRVLDAIARTPLGSRKELAAKSGVSEETAKKTLTWLRKNALVQKSGGVYRLTIPRPRVTAAPDLAHDAFRQRALGKTLAEVLAAIERGSIRTAHDLADAAQCTLSRARRALTRLRQAGLVEKFAGTYRRLDKPLETVAHEHGTLGVGKRQRKQHIHERDRFREAVEHGELQPGFGKRKLHVVPKGAPAPVWDGTGVTEERPLKMAASFRRRR